MLTTAMAIITGIIAYIEDKNEDIGWE